MTQHEMLKRAPALVDVRMLHYAVAGHDTPALPQKCRRVSSIPKSLKNLVVRIDFCLRYAELCRAQGHNLVTANQNRKGLHRCKPFVKSQD